MDTPLGVRRHCRLLLVTAALGVIALFSPGRGVAGEPVPLDEKERRRFSYPYGNRNVTLVPETDRVAVLLEEAGPGRLETVRRLVANDPVFARPEASDEQAYRNLWFLRFRTPLVPLERDAALARVEAHPQVSFASVVLGFRETLVIPKPELLVTVEDVSIEEALAVAEDLAVVRALPALRPTYLLEYSGPTLMIFERANRLRRLPGVVVAQPNFIQYLRPHLHPNDPLFVYQANLENLAQTGGTPGADVSGPEGWSFSTGHRELVIAIVDEGVDVAHEDLAPHLIEGYDATDQPPPKGIPGNCDVTDPHGTACACISASIGNNGIGLAGVAWDVSVMPIRVGYGSLWTEDAWVIDALTWASDHGADVISNSWGGSPPSQLVQMALAYVKTLGREGRGCPIVFSSGNFNADVSYPGAFPETICVGATSPCDERKNPDSCDGEFWWGSNFGPELDLVAPGPRTTTTDIMGADGYSTGHYTGSFSGTSASAPLVSGAAILLLNLQPNLTADEVQDFLEATADDEIGIPTEDASGWDPYMGHGRLNLERLLVAAGGVAAPRDFDCSGSGVSAILRWSNPDDYSSIVITRDQVEIATLPGDAVSFEEATAPGTHLYQVRGEKGTSASPNVTCTLFLGGTATDLVWSPPDADGDVDSGGDILAALAAQGRDAVGVDDLDLVFDLNDFSAIWVTLGIFPHKHALTDPESSRLVEYLVDGVGGGLLYLEGGDTWAFDAPTPLHELFAIDPTGDGRADLGLQEGRGAGICDLTGLSVGYSGENRSIDRLAPHGDGLTLLTNVSPGYDVVVFNNPTAYRTLGASHEFGGLTEAGTHPVEILSAYLDCLGEPRVPHPVSDLTCTVTGARVDLTWRANGTYTSLELSKDWEFLVTLPGSATSYADIGVAHGNPVYRVRANWDGETSPTRACAAPVDVPLNIVLAGVLTGTPGGTVTEVIQASTARPLEGFSLAVSFDPRLLQVEGISLEETTVGAVGADIFLPNWDNDTGSYTVEVVVDATPPVTDTVPPSNLLSLVRTDFRIDSGASLGQLSPLTIEAEIDGVETLFVQGGEFHEPVRMPGVVQVEEPALVRLISTDLHASAGMSGISHRVTATTEYDVQGFAFGLDFDASVFRVDSVTLDGTVTGALGAEFFAPFVNNVAGFYTVGVVIDVSPPLDTVLPAGTDQTIIRSLAHVTPDAPEGRYPLLLPLSVGTPPVEATVAAVNGDFIPELIPGVLEVTTAPLFVRGDSDMNAALSLNDPLQTLLYLFAGGMVRCRDAADVNDDGGLGLADALLGLGYLFQNGPEPPPPFPGPGPDPTSDSLDCVQGL